MKHPDPKIVELAKILGELNPVEIVTPVNVAEEKEAWCEKARRGIFTNPRFRYNHDSLKAVADSGDVLNARMNYLYSIFTPETEAEGAIAFIIRNRFVEAMACTAIASSILRGDDVRTSTLCQSVYGLPDDTQITEAYNIVANGGNQGEISSILTKEELSALRGKSFNAAEIARWFNEVIHWYNGIDGWTVEIGDQYTSVDVRDKNSSGRPVVGIPTSKNVDGVKLIELAGHELQWHLRSSANCKALLERVLGENSLLAPLFGIIAKSDNELFYEGVAKIEDVRIRGDSALPLPYATIACDLARHGKGFASIGGAIKEARLCMGQNEEVATNGAWTTTYRIMRGSTNPNIGGYCFPKDYIYMSGFNFARKIAWHDYSAMTADEINRLIEGGIDLSQPRYPARDVVSWLKNALLSGNVAE